MDRKVNRMPTSQQPTKTTQHTSHEPQGKDKEFVSSLGRLVGDPGGVKGIAAYIVEPGWGREGGYSSGKNIASTSANAYWI